MPGWIDLDKAILPLSSRVSPTKAGFIGEIVDRQGQVVWASEPNQMRRRRTGWQRLKRKAIARSGESGHNAQEISQSNLGYQVPKKGRRTLNQPLSTPQPISTADLTFLPAFVREKVLAEADDDGLEGMYVGYEERAGTIEGATEVAQITIRAGGLDLEGRWLHLGGSNCWLVPDHHAVYFDAIAEDLLPETPDSHIWWLLSIEDVDPPILHIVKITLVPGPEAPDWDL